MSITTTISTGIGGTQVILECEHCWNREVIEGKALGNLVRHMSTIGAGRGD